MMNLVSNAISTVSFAVWAITVLTDINYARKMYNRCSDTVQYLVADRNIVIHKNNNAKI